MADGFFITGTDTEVGKTVVSGALIRHLVSSGKRVAGLKPIASGFTRVDGRMQNEDVETLVAASNVELPMERVNRYAFEPPIAPHIAAQQHKCLIDGARIISDLEYASDRSDIVVMEGVGGWMVPLSESGEQRLSVETLAQMSGLLVVLVVGLRLGCLNHALLTVRAIKDSGVPFAGWVANHCSAGFDYCSENIATLQELIDAPMLFEMPFQADSERPVELLNIHSSLAC